MLLGSGSITMLSKPPVDEELLYKGPSLEHSSADDILVIVILTTQHGILDISSYHMPTTLCYLSGILSAGFGTTPKRQQSLG